jgi:hypothetical protein
MVGTHIASRIRANRWLCPPYKTTGFNYFKIAS